jgi:L-alanine-DL-glutamate epimerase-like enolase superfamily enzyme
MRVIGVDVALCSFELPHPVRLGPVEYRCRDYVALRVCTEDAAVAGYAAGYTRGTPLFEAVCLLAPSIVGADALARGALFARLEAAHRPGHAALVRALSLLEMALWDLTAKQAALPLHAVLGGTREVAPAMGVCGYFIEERGEEAILDDLRRLEQDGFARLKLMLGARPPLWMLRFLTRAKEALAPDTLLGVDVHYSLASLEEGVRLVRALDGLGLAFIEDPFDPARWRQLVALSRQVSTPVAAGEDVVSPLQYRDILEGAAILRVDPSTCGGFGSAIEGIELATAMGASVIPHGFVGVNAQLAGAFPAVSAVEVIPPEISSDGFEKLVEPACELRDGSVHLDRAPGAGLRLDWEGVVAAAVATWSTQSDL